MKALPWIEHEPIILNEILKDLGKPLASVKIFSLKIQLSLLIDWRNFYERKFDPERDLIGEKRIFEGWKLDKGETDLIKDRLSFDQGNEEEDTWKGSINWDLDELQAWGPGASGNFTHPREEITVGQFIFLLNYAGIPLTFTPYALEQITGAGN